MTSADHRRPHRRDGVTAALWGDSTDAGDLELNTTGYAVWDLCDGGTTVDEMVDAAAEVFDVPPETLRADVSRILEELESVGAIEWIKG